MYPYANNRVITFGAPRHGRSALMLSLDPAHSHASVTLCMQVHASALTCSELMLPARYVAHATSVHTAACQSTAHVYTCGHMSWAHAQMQ